MYGTVQFKVHTRVQAHVCACASKLACTHIVACNFGMRTQANEHTEHMRDGRHELTLSSPHWTYGVATGTVAVGNEMQLFCG